MNGVLSKAFAFFPLIALSLSVSACASSVEADPLWAIKAKPAEYVAERTNLDRSPERECSELRTIPIKDDRRTFLSSGEEIIFYLTASSCDEPTSYKIEVESSYDNEWRVYDRAFTADGKQLKLERRSKSVIGCTGMLSHGEGRFTEQFVIFLSHEHMQRASGEGLNIRLLARNESEISFEIPASVFEGILLKAARNDIDLR